MAEQDQGKQTASSEDDILQQQFLRGLSTFEGIILSQIDVKNKLGDRLNYSIRAGIILLGVIAISILVLLLTLSSQITRISGVVTDMNAHFGAVSRQMHEVRGHMDSMSRQVGLLDSIKDKTAVMDAEMREIRGDMNSMQDILGGISAHVGAVRVNVANISTATDMMNREVQVMSQEMHHMAKPARTMNKMFPFP